MNDENPDPRATPAPYQVASEYGMSSSVNIAWLALSSSTSAWGQAFDDAWDRLVVHDEWRRWVENHLIPPSPFLCLLVRDNIDKRLLRKTKSGLSMHLPASEVARAEQEGALLTLFVGVIQDIYEKWARISGCPSPPEPPAVD